MKIKYTAISSIIAMLFLSISVFAQVDNSYSPNIQSQELELQNLAIEEPGFVFVGTNHNNSLDAKQPANQIAMYKRAADGKLTLVNYFDTGGQGSGPSKRFAGDGLGSSHSVQLSRDRSFLFVTNAGSNNLTVFSIKKKKQSLVRVDLVPTGDGSPNNRFPNSVTQYKNLVYVLNSGDQGSITGFRINKKGKLTPLQNSTRILNANQKQFAPDTLFNPTQISFTPDGKKLVITIKDGPTEGLIPGATPTGPGRVLVFNVETNGTPSATFTQTDLNNNGPFGFSFDTRGNLLIALFVGGDNLAAAAGSFKINQDGTLTPITRSLKISQLDTCWLENNGKFAFGANYTSGTISSFTIGNDGSLALLNETAGSTDNPGNKQGSTPLDIRVSPNGRFVYNVLPGSGKVAGWRINADGSLTKIGEFEGLPKTVDGDNAPEERFGLGGSPAGIEVF